MMIRVLHIEDNAWFSNQAHNTLRLAAPFNGVDLETTVVPTLAEAEARLHENWDAILLDLMLPDSEAKQTLAWLDARAKTLPPVVVITGMDTWGLQKECMFSGAEDFINSGDVLTKPNEAVRVICAAVWRHCDSIKRYAS